VGWVDLGEEGLSSVSEFYDGCSSSLDVCCVVEVADEDVASLEGAMAVFDNVYAVGV